MLLKLFTLFISIISFNAFAFKLSPMKAELAVSGKKATKSFRVINDTKEKVKIEAEVMTRAIDLNNKETRKETEDFTLYPPQLEVEPGKSKVIRVSYIGKKTDKEVPYRLIVRQIPTKKAEKKPGAQINILFEYVASLYITPKNVKADISVEKSYKIDNRIEIFLNNRGSKHTLLRKYKLELTQGKKKKTIDFTEIKYKEFGSQNLLAGIKRKLVIPDTHFGAGKVQTKFIRK